LLQRARGLDFGNPLPPYFLGLIDLREGRAESAEAEFRRAIEMNATNAMAYAGHGLALSQIGHPEKGLDQALFGLRLNPRDGFAGLMNLKAGEAALILGRDDEALKQFTQAVRLMPRSGPAKLSLASALALSGEHPRARQLIAEYRTLGLMPLEQAAGWMGAGPGKERFRQGLALAMLEAP
jgi:tetratricopeptide (TPR) repeat protein